MAPLTGIVPIMYLELALTVKIHFSKFPKRICNHNISNKDATKFFVTYEYLPCSRCYYRSLKLFYKDQNSCNLFFKHIFPDLRNLRSAQINSHTKIKWFPTIFSGQYIKRESSTYLIHQLRAQNKKTPKNRYNTQWRTALTLFSVQCTQTLCQISGKK